MLKISTERIWIEMFHIRLYQFNKQIDGIFIIFCTKFMANEEINVMAVLKYHISANI